MAKLWRHFGFVTFAELAEINFEKFKAAFDNGAAEVPSIPSSPLRPRPTPF